MTKRAELKDGQERELLKAAAQAWHSRSGNCRPINEFDARRRHLYGRPTRFKLEAAARNDATARWDFKQSLWDSYEIVAVAKRLETGLVLDDPVSALDDPNPVSKRRREGKNSLRNLFNLMSSRRFKKPQAPCKEDKTRR